MSIETVVEQATRRHKTLYYYDQEEGDLSEQFQTRNVEVVYRPLPPGGPEPFVVIREAGDFRGALRTETLQEFLWPPIQRVEDVDSLSSKYRALYEILDDTVFTSMSRRQLLATSREIEDRALRRGTGTLHAGFQSTDAFRAQQSLYDDLATETALDLHLYYDGEPTGEIQDRPSMWYHTEPADVVGRYWFLVFDGGGHQGMKCALVAEQRDEATYNGVWTYDPVLVDEALDTFD